MKNSLQCAALLAGSLWVAGCMTNNDNPDPEYDKYKDTEITSSTLQASLSGQAGNMQDWDGAMENPIDGVDIPGTSGGSDWPAMQKASVLQKTATDDPTVIDSSTKAQGYVTVSVRRRDLLSTTYDTAVVKWDAKSQDTIQGNENIIRWSHTVVLLNGLSVDRTAFTDDDGDGLVNVVAGRDNRIRIEFTKTTNSGSKVETAVVSVSPGPDNNFDTEGDNRIYRADWNRKVNGTLTALASFTDDDGDGIMLNNAAVSVVKLTAWESEPTLRPRVKSVAATLRIRKLGFGLGDEPVGFTYNDTLKNGRTDKVFLKNSAGGADIIAGDSLRVFLETSQKDGNDSLRSLNVEVGLNLGNDLKSDTDDVFYSLRADAHNRHGFERDVHFLVVSNTPLHRGQKPQSGSFSLEVTYANRKTASVEGTFTPTAFDATYTGPKGDTLTVHYNR